MTRRKLLSTFIALFAMTLVTLMADAGSASAQQNPKCCTYTVNIQGVGADCFRVPFWILWDNTLVGPTVLTSNGVFNFQVPGNCPPAALFNGVSLGTPNGPFATYNHPVQFRVNGCCLVARITYDADGCVVIYIRPC